MILRSLALAVLFVLAAPAASRPADKVSEASLRRHIEVLAADEMEGRRPGTSGADAAVQYIAGQLAAAGLHPGARAGGWYAPVRLVERKPMSAVVRWRARNVDIPVAPADVVLVGRTATEHLSDAPIIFVGHAFEDPALGLRNLDGVEVRGAVVLLLPGKPEGFEKAPDTDARRDALVRRGAAAVILLARSTDLWDVVRGPYEGGETRLASSPVAPVSGAVAYDMWGRIVRAAGEDQAELIAAAARPDFRAWRLDISAAFDVRTAVRAYSSWNVIGQIEGSDADDEALIFLAHWDHIGLCRPPGEKDRICNGAVDNASGVAMLIEVARGLAAGPKPARDILFVATTAEELGLLGAKALAADPPMPLGSIAAVLNFDTVAIARRGAPVTIIGRGMTPLDPVVDSVAEAVGRTVNTSTDANQFITRQDAWAFTQAGVPAAMIGGSFADLEMLEAFLSGPYHQPHDDLTRRLVLGGAAEDATFHIALGRALADPERFPLAKR